MTDMCDGGAYITNYYLSNVLFV